MKEPDHSSRILIDQDQNGPDRSGPGRGCPF